VADVFISYSQRAPEPTVELAAALLDRGYSPTYDVNLLPGDVFGAVIMGEIDAAKAVVTIWSEPALTSTWVPAESQRAHDQKKLVCVRTAEVNPNRLPIPFNAVNTPLYTEIDGIVAKLQKLGCRPSGVAESELTPEDVLARHALRDWSTHIGKSQVTAEIEAFLQTYRTLPMYKRLAQARLDLLRAGEAGAAPAPAPAVRIVRPEDVTIRIDAGMHLAPIKRIAVTADGKMLATGSDDKTVRLWSLPGGEQIRTLRPRIAEGDVGKIYAVAIDPAGRWTAAGGWTGNDGQYFVNIFDNKDGVLTARLGPLPNVVHDLAVSPDGMRLAAGLGGGDGVCVWTNRFGAWTDPIAIGPYGGAVYGLTFAQDGRLAVTCYDGYVRLYAPDMRLLASTKAPSNTRLFGVAFSPDGSVLAVGSRDIPNIDVFDSATLEPLWRANTTGIANPISNVAWLNGGRLAAGGIHWDNRNNRPVFAWSDAGRGQRDAWPGGQDTIMDIAAHSDGGVVFGGADPAFGLISADGDLALWRGPPNADLRGKLRENFLVSADGKQIRFGLGAGARQPHLFDVAARTLVVSATAPKDLAPPNTDRLKVDGWEDTVSPILLRKGLFKTTQVPLPLERYEMSRSLAVAPDAKSFALGTAWSLRCYTAAGVIVWNRSVPSDVWGLHVARRGRLILAAYGDGTIRWHRASDGAELLALFVHVPADPNAQKQWILFTPKGYYDCSPGADSLIGWHLNRGDDEEADFYPAETFASTFKKPSVIDTALNDC
jgi:WD40 repeat protein